MNKVQSIHKRDLAPARRELVELMQRINFGRIEALPVRDGQPDLHNAGVRVVEEVKFASENGPRPEAGADDFALRAQVVELLAHFDRLQNARIEVLSIKHGLPFGMHVENRR